MDEWFELICIRGLDWDEWLSEWSGFCDFSLIKPVDEIHFYCKSGRKAFYRTNEVVVDEFGIHTVFQLDE